MEKAFACSQTTFPPDVWEQVLEALKARIPHLGYERTICSATAVRQAEARELASGCDAMIVVGGRHSANTRKLYQACL